MKTVICPLCVLGILLPIILVGYNPPQGMQRYPLRVGETMRFNVKALGVVGLQATLYVLGKDDYAKVRRYHGRRQSYRIRMIIQTVNWVRPVYDMKDVLTTYMDADSFLPLLVYKNLREGNFRNKSRVIFYHKRGYALYSDTWKKRRNKKSKILPHTLDLVSLVYYLRGFQVNSRNRGKRYDLSYLSGPKLRKTKILFRDRPARKAPVYFQGYRKLADKPYSHSRVSQQGSHKVSVYVTEDKWRVPTYVLAESIQYRSRVKLKGYNIARFMRLGAYLDYYNVLKL